MSNQLKNIKPFLALLCLVLLTSLGVRAQQLPEFNMSDTTITVCRGILYDSGGLDGIYGVSENTTTVIQTGGTISLTFINQFCIENNLDFLYIYDGPDTSSPLLGTFTGTNLPPALTATSGAVTVVLTSDPTVSYCGFSMQWISDNPPPIPPVISVDPLPLCGDNTVQIDFSYPIACDWLNTAEWTFDRNGDPINVISATPNCTGDSTTQVTLLLDGEILSNCPYNTQLVIGIPDDCGIIYVFTLTTSFNFSGCAVDATISASDNLVCPNACANITAIVQGCFAYSYSWDHGLPPTAGPHQVCPATTTTYNVVITENETGATTALSYTIQVENSQINIPDQTLCQSVDDIVMTAGGVGEWRGDGLEFETNIFDPDSVPGGGVTYVYYETANCIDSVQFIIIPIQTDDTTAACPGSPDFQLNAVPAGGTWSGPFTTSTGTFTPSTEGSYTTIYSLGACTDVLTVNVDSISGVFELDTICQSVWADTILFSPVGGYWSGEGIIDSLRGIFVPANATPGDITLLYTINGCTMNAHVFVKEINIGTSFETACPDQTPLVWYDGAPAPPGGYWTGDGVIDTSSGLFDPSIIPNDTYTNIIYYAPNGCSDTTYIYVRQTEIVEDTLYFCETDDAIQLNEESVGNVPDYGGEWTGSGVSEPWYDGWFFDPATAGPGVHVLTYLKNTCQDSIVMVVYPSSLQNDAYQLCSTEPPFLLEPQVMAGGTWSGSNAVDPQTGMFNPGSAEEGQYYVYWNNPGGCGDSILINLEHLDQAVISGLNSAYCFLDSNYVFTTSPDGGALSGDLTSNGFNPEILGVGNYQVIYTVQGINCTSADTVNFSISPELIATLAVTDTILCPGESTTLTVTATGGTDPNAITYLWSDGAFPVNVNNASPSQSTTISVVITDNCSTPIIDSVYIQVLPKVQVDVITSDTLCFGEIGFAQAQVLSSGNYSIEWNGVEGAETEVSAGAAQTLQITDLDNGCVWDSTVFIPTFLPVVANFSVNPNQDCIPFGQSANINFIDYSQNATEGTWNFGNGQTADYSFGNVPPQSYSAPGLYTITLIVSNGGACSDTAYASVCILPPTPIYVPDIFSPNGDGRNDVFYVRSRGIIDMDLSIYNRWGERVFRSKDPEFGWDGTYQNKPAQSGSYVYYLSAKLNDGTEQEMHGELTLVR